MDFMRRRETRTKGAFVGDWGVVDREGIGTGGSYCATYVSALGSGC